MGKNPNAKKLKIKKKGGEKEFDKGHDIETLEEEAARRGCNIWELDEIRREQDEIENGSSDDDEGEEKKSEDE